MKTQHELLMAELVEGGLSRKALVNDDYHKKKPWQVFIWFAMGCA